VAEKVKPAQLHHLSLSTNDDDDDDKDGSTNSGIISVFKIITRALLCDIMIPKAKLAPVIPDLAPDCYLECCRIGDINGTA